MIFKELGQTGEKIPVLGIGTWKIGIDPERDVKSIKSALDLGMRFIDTAEMYHTEEIVGRVIRSEKGVFVATKVSPHHFHYADVINSCDESLKRLGIKTIDLYMLHWPNPNVPIAETMKAMEQLVKEGKIRHIGVSNFSVQEIREAQGVMKSNEIVSNEVEYSIFCRDIEGDGVLQFCRKEKITVIAYSPLAMGRLFDKGTNAYQILGAIAKRNKKSISQIALNWVISKQGVVAIPKAGDPAHTAENAGACDFKLSDADYKKLGSIENNYNPVSSNINPFTKRSSALWSGLMDKRENLRSKLKI